MVQTRLPPEVIDAVRSGDLGGAVRLLQQHAGLDLAQAAAAVQSLQRHLRASAGGAAARVEQAARPATGLAPGVEQALARGDLLGAWREARQAMRNQGGGTGAVAARGPSSPAVSSPAAAARRAQGSLLGGLSAPASLTRQPTVRPGDPPGRGLATLAVLVGLIVLVWWGFHAA